VKPSVRLVAQALRIVPDLFLPPRLEPRPADRRNTRLPGLVEELQEVENEEELRGLRQDKLKPIRSVAEFLPEGAA
jgi:hypothetical protein